MTRRIIARDERARLISQTRTIICAICVIENVSPDGGLPKGWKPVPGGVHCPDCVPVWNPKHFETDIARSGEAVEERSRGHD